MPAITLRPIRDDAEFNRLAEILVASETADGNPLTLSGTELAEDQRDVGAADLAHDLVIAEVNGQAIGFGRVRCSELLEGRTYRLSGYVLPGWRRQGVGRALLSWLEDRAAALTGERPTSSTAVLRLNASQCKLGLHALAQQGGYDVKEIWALMVRPSLDDIPDVPLPSGLELRPARPRDYGAIWRAVEEAYVPEGGPAPSGVMPEDMQQGRNFQPELWQVAWEMARNRVVGSVMTYIFHEENRQLGIRRGYTEGISTTPDWQRRGVASALIARSLRVQCDHGMTESAMVCNVAKPGNYRLYLRCGFREVKRDTVYERVQEPVTDAPT